MRITQHYRRRWLYFFIYTLILSITAKTYNLEKAPIIYYLFYFYLIEIIIGQKKVVKLIIPMMALVISIIIVQYVGIMEYRGKIFTLSSGPGGRIFISQIAPLLMHVQIFPDMEPFLNGASLPTALAVLTGASDSWVRSARIVIEITNPTGVAAGIAGVMNALFAGEAYANWGILGVLVSPFIVALPLSVTFALLLRQPKTPIAIAFYIAVSSIFFNAIQGGIVDFLYNAAVMMIIIFFVSIHTFSHKGKLVLHINKV